MVQVRFPGIVKNLATEHKGWEIQKIPGKARLLLKCLRCVVWMAHILPNLLNKHYIAFISKL